MLEFAPILLCTSIRSKIARARERSIRLSRIYGDALNSRSSKRSRVPSAFSGICIRFACENERTYVYASRSSPLFKDTLVLTIFVRIRCRQRRSLSSCLFKRECFENVPVHRSALHTLSACERVSVEYKKNEREGERERKRQAKRGSERMAVAV